MRSPRDFSAVGEFREYWVKCMQLLGMMTEDEFDGVLGIVSEDLNLCREYRRQNQQTTPPLPLDNALDEVKFELDQISDGQISNLIDNNLLDNVGDLLEEELLNNADTRPTLRENIGPAVPFESLGNFHQGTFEGQQYHLGVDYSGLQNTEDTRFTTQMMAAGRSHMMEAEAEPSRIQHLDSFPNLSPTISAPVNLGPVPITSQTKSGGRESNWMEAKGWKKVELSGSPVTTCGQARRERNLKAFENKSSLAAERRAKETERRSKEMARRQVTICISICCVCLCVGLLSLSLHWSDCQVAMERKNALTSARQSGTAGHPSNRSRGKDIKVMKSEFLNRETEASTGSTGSVIQQLETSIEKMESSGVGTGQLSLTVIWFLKTIAFFMKE